MSSYIYHPASKSAFNNHFNDNTRVRERVRQSCSVFDGSYVHEGTKYFLSTRGYGGFAVRLSGEIVYLHSSLPNHGNTLVKEAIKRGGTWLTCFDGYLTELYSRHGFVEESREPNWTHGLPDVITMRLSGKN